MHDHPRRSKDYHSARVRISSQEFFSKDSSHDDNKKWNQPYSEHRFNFPHEMEELSPELQKIAPSFDAWFRLLFLILQFFKFLLVTMCDMHEPRCQKGVHNGTNENDCPKEVHRIGFDPGVQLLIKIWNVVVVILIERFGKEQVALTGIDGCGRTYGGRPPDGKT